MSGVNYYCAGLDYAFFHCYLNGLAYQQIQQVLVLEFEFAELAQRAGGIKSVFSGLMPRKYLNDIS